MGIHYQNRVIGEVRATHINGHPSLGAAQLRFVLAWNLFPKRDDVFTIFNTSIWVSVAPEGDATAVMLGQAMPESAWCEESRDGEPFDRPVTYRISLPLTQLLALEESRHTRGLRFTLDVRGNSLGPDGLRALYEQLHMHVNISDWVRVLKESGFADVLVVGVQLPTKVESHARPAVELVRRAHEHILMGHYAAAVAECRRAIESLWKSAHLTAAARDARKRLVNMDGQLSMSKRDRELALGEALRIYCHTAHHVGDDAAPEIVGRSDANLAVSTAASLISSLLADPDLVQSKPASAAIVTRPEAPFSGVSLTKTSTGKDPDKAEEASNLAQQVAKVREHLTSNPKNRPGTVRKLRSVLESLFAKRLDSAGLERLERELIRQKVVTETAGKLTYI